MTISFRFIVLATINLIYDLFLGIYIKICVYNKEQLIKSKKTSIKSLSSIVCFNELISFNVNEDKIKETSLEILGTLKFILDLNY